MLANFRGNPERNELFLFCPIETKAREMDAKVLLACVAAERGHKVIIGDMAELRGIVEFLPRGIYMSKSIPDKMERHFRRFKSLGYGVVAWCEEGLIFPSRKVYARKMVSEGALEYTDLFFAWGENQVCAVLEKAPASRNKIRSVGNSRIDVLRRPFRGIYRKEAERLRATYGDYILFNTNFAIANNVLGTQGAYESSKKRGKIKTQEAEEYYWEYFAHRKAIFEKTVELVGAVSAAYPERRIIIRPHPSENHETWKNVTSSLKNVDVVFEGSAIPWLLGTNVLIHSGCTTAVEAYFLDVPSISFRPLIREGYELELPNDVSIQAHNIDDVVAKIESVCSKKNDYVRWKKEAGRKLKLYVENADGLYASDCIVEELERHYAEAPIVPEPAFYPILRLWTHRAKELLRVVKYGRQYMKERRLRYERKYRRQKLPDLSADEMRCLIDALKRESGRFAGVNIEALEGTRRCFVVVGS